MNICWANDFMDAGGAEVTSKYVLDLLGEHRTIGLLTPDSYLFPIAETDLIVVNNFRRFSLRVVKEFFKKPFIYFPHDVLPMSHEHEVYARELLIKSKRNIFLSPLHRQKVLEKYGLEGSEKNFDYMPYFDVDLYNNERPKNFVKKNICWVGSMYSHKGIDNVLNFARKNKMVIDFYGKGDINIVAQLYHSKYAELRDNWSPEVYGDYEYFVHLPSEVEALGRCVVEAMLSGCTCIDNGNIGFKSWNIEGRDEFIEIMNTKQEEIAKAITE